MSARIEVPLMWGRIITTVVLCSVFSVGLVCCTPPDSKVTIYPVQCLGELKGGNCSGKMLPLNKTTFKVSVARQSIIYWTVGIDLPPRRLANCVVRDGRNWVGYFPDGSGELRMVNGRFHRSPSYPDTFCVPWWRWWYLYLTGHPKG